MNQPAPSSFRLTWMTACSPSDETVVTPRGLGADGPGSGHCSPSLEGRPAFHNAVRAFFRAFPLIGEAQTPFKSRPRLFGTRGALLAWLMQ
jgi:hypothetical protein